MIEWCQETHGSIIELYYHLLTTWWCNQIKQFSTLLVFCVGNSLVTGEISPQRPMTQSFLLSAPEQTVQRPMETAVILGAIVLIMTSL